MWLVCKKNSSVILGAQPPSAVVQRAFELNSVNAQKIQHRCGCVRRTEDEGVLGCARGGRAPYTTIGKRLDKMVLLNRIKSYQPHLSKDRL
jgi:hypothetical protein